jgi:hypothetical protein
MTDNKIISPLAFAQAAGRGRAAERARQVSPKKTQLELPPRDYEGIVVNAVRNERVSADMSDAEIKRLLDFAHRLAVVAWRLGIKVPRTLPKDPKSFGMVMDAFWADIGFELIWETQEFRRQRGRPKVPEKYLVDDPDAVKQRRYRYKRDHPLMAMWDRAPGNNNH